MTLEQKQYKMLILADLSIVETYYNSMDKYNRLIAAFHMQQAIEKTIKLKAQIHNLMLHGSDIKAMLKDCELIGVEINTPDLIKKKADTYTSWETCGYTPSRCIRKETIRNAYITTVAWLNSGETAN